MDRQRQGVNVEGDHLPDARLLFQPLQKLGANVAGGPGNRHYLSLLGHPILLSRWVNICEVGKAVVTKCLG